MICRQYHQLNEHAQDYFQMSLEDVVNGVPWNSTIKQKDNEIILLSERN